MRDAFWGVVRGFRAGLLAESEIEGTILVAVRDLAQTAAPNGRISRCLGLARRAWVTSVDSSRGWA